ncbi:hypothetical protein FA13DRAFT_1782777 [Coprinellus micaceus]|uniref:Uncharacterized protein n=1 Tax=Coprinellus micaceus TaxID=71717 RepID=A0A4Y7RX19_COPMI|nr:hypothetical protein FA13DRAFT_1782777 [Coprinellus micaceus]
MYNNIHPSRVLQKVAFVLRQSKRTRVDVVAHIEVGIEIDVIPVTPRSRQNAYSATHNRYAMQYGETLTEDNLEGTSINPQPYFPQTSPAFIVPQRTSVVPRPVSGHRRFSAYTSEPQRRPPNIAGLPPASPTTFAEHRWVSANLGAPGVLLLETGARKALL